MAKLLENCKKWVSFQIQKNCKWQESRYLPKVNGCLLGIWILKSAVCLCLLVYFFYRSWIAVLGLFPIGIYIIYYQWKDWQKRMLMQIEVGFRDWLYYVKEGIAAGKSFEQAMLQCKASYLSILDSKHPFLPGLMQLYREMELHLPIEDSIKKIGDETELWVIKDFAMIFLIVRKQGGHMTVALERTIKLIYEQIELRQEIQAMLQAKKLEHLIMCIMPVGILCFVGRISIDYFKPLYHNFQGVVIMSFFMIVYLAGVWWGVKMTEVSL